MIQKGFGERWNCWITGCLDHPHFSIMLNGTSKGFFESSRGIQQGDPLSPFLFTLVVDALSEPMAKAKSRGVIEGFPIGNVGYAINHLHFVNGTMCFLKAEDSQVYLLKDILRIFETISDLKINLLKTTLAGIAVAEEEVLRFARIMECQVDTWPMKYLELPLGGVSKSLSFWDPVVKRIQGKLKCWK